MNEKRQMSDTICIGIMLAIVGGFLDAYTYLCRGEVFANAQTGNMVLFGIKLIKQNYIQALYYLLPILAFLIGVIVAEMIKRHFLENTKVHWQTNHIMYRMVCLAHCRFFTTRI